MKIQLLLNLIGLLIMTGHGVTCFAVEGLDPNHDYLVYSADVGDGSDIYVFEDKKLTRRSAMRFDFRKGQVKYSDETICSWSLGAEKRILQKCKSPIIKTNMSNHAYEEYIQLAKSAATDSVFSLQYRGHDYWFKKPNLSRIEEAKSSRQDRLTSILTSHEFLEFQVSAQSCVLKSAEEFQRECAKNILSNQYYLGKNGSTNYIKDSVNSNDFIRESLKNCLPNLRIGRVKMKGAYLTAPDSADSVGSGCEFTKENGHWRLENYRAYSTGE